MASVEASATWKSLGVAVLLLLSAGVIQPVASSTTADLITQTLEQLDLALQQAVLAHVRFPLEDLQLHAHAVINVLEGRAGAHYDSSYANPGDGVGVVSYLEQIRQAPEIWGASEELRVALENVSSYLKQAIDHTLRALAEKDLANAQAEMRWALAFLSAAKGREVELTAVSGLLGLKARLAPTPASSPSGSEK